MFMAYKQILKIKCLEPFQDNNSCLAIRFTFLQYTLFLCLKNPAILCNLKVPFCT